MRVSGLKAPVNYLLAAGSVAVTVVLAMLLRDYLGNSPKLLFVPAVVFSSFFAVSVKV